MTHHLFTEGQRPAPAQPGRAKPMTRRRWAILGTAALCLCLAVAIAADTGHRTGTGTAASRAAAAARARGDDTQGYQGYRAGRAGAGARSVGRAYQFLTLMLNLHDPGGGSPADLPTLPQSYLGGDRKSGV